MSAKTFLIRFLASGGFISYIPARLTGFKKFTGSGMAGTLLALAFVPFLPENKTAFAFFCLAFLPFSVWIADLASKSYGTHDDPRIVIDEMIGYWTAILFLDRTPFNLAAAFILFRALDTLKPWPIKNLETGVRGGFGIIIDDVLAGVEANLLARLAALILL
jgi:phosphatidylglycerophosphatase A